ncbi:class I adenylate-forming enzyme family protein [Novosphingobium pentaromativorans]|uniref:AMP-dependent synthetase and ligase n=1 Tax=Novosphingobium pentaromativorans US6-1 TaxID=1088721 RepID=G6E834_9SPHN|nr:fatty acid--CoA ligase family protein [Novosphingobium pentaromativorans]EHJ62374.1 hypothetical protein NSU_0505 [Novosphingobium pentaromativorans US6-1]
MTENSGVAHTVRDILAQDGDARAFHFKGKWYDWRWVNRFIDGLEAEIAKSGVADTESIGVAPRNGPDFAAALLSAIGQERQIVMIYAYQSPEAIAGRIRDLDLALVLLARSDCTDVVLQAAEQCGTAVVALSVEGSELILMGDGKTHHPAPPVAGIELLTSGTTGAPKHFLMTYPQLYRSMITENPTTTVSTTPGLHYYPFGNISGLYQLLPIVAVHRPVQMLDKFRVEDWVDYVATYKPPALGMPTAGYRMLLEAGVEDEPLSSLKYFLTGASALDPNTHDEFVARYGRPILQSYGATEFGGVVAQMTLEDHEKFSGAKVRSVGRPWHGARLRISDPETGAELPAGEIGRIDVISPRMSDDWIETTDLGLIDEDGFLYHHGRLDGAIMRGGFKVVPETISTTLTAHPAIAVAAALGMPDQRLGEVPVIAYEVRPEWAPPSEEELQKFLTDRLPKPSLPVRYLRMDRMPRTPSLKVDLGAVRRAFEAA